MTFINQYKDNLNLLMFYCLLFSFVIDFNHLRVIDYLLLITAGAWLVTWIINIYYDFQLKKLKRELI